MSARWVVLLHFNFVARWCVYLLCQDLLNTQIIVSACRQVLTGAHLTLQSVGLCAHIDEKF
jgi:hypothetical protein